MEAVSEIDWRGSLPFQEMLGDRPVEVYSFSELSGNMMPTPHRHKFDMILWVKKGTGVHEIEYQSYEMVPGRLFVIPKGQVHFVKQYAEDGVVVLIKENSGMKLESSVWRSFYNVPYVELNGLNCDIFMGLFSFLQIEARNKYPDLPIIENLLNGMLLTLSRQLKPVKIYYTSGNLDTVLRVRDLIEQHYLEHKDPEFYSRQTNMTLRKLNKILRDIEGKTIHQLLQDRLLVESRSLLSVTRLSVKEIAFILGFEDPAYFCRFFKKKAGNTPHTYRELNAAFNTPSTGQIPHS